MSHTRKPENHPVQVCPHTVRTTRTERYAGLGEAPDILGGDDRPAFFPIGNAEEIGLDAPEDRHGMGVRTWVRALARMQKEAFTINASNVRAWRLISDEARISPGTIRPPAPCARSSRAWCRLT